MRVAINGNTVAAEEGQTILDLARKNGIYIPHLCDFPGLEAFTGCRLCLVEVKGRRGYSPACSTTIDDGMDIKTDSPALKALRSQILELILSEHPSACLICSEKESCDEHKSTIRKVGETTGCVLCPNNTRCDLQDVVDALGLDCIHFPAVYRNIEIKKTDPFFDRNYNLCILCGRCVRVCHEIRGASAIAFNYRGSDAVIGTVLDKPLKETGCQFCGACVDVCPTGALTERALKYEIPSETRAKTVCLLCSSGCTLEAELRDGRILGTRPAGEGAVNKGQACVRGRFALRDVVQSPGRLTKPKIRKNGRLEDVDWDEALSFVSRGLNNYKGTEIACVGSPNASCEDGFVLRKFASEVLKTTNVVSVADVSPLAEYKKLGYDGEIRLDAIGKAGVVLLVGGDLPLTHPMAWLQVLKSVRNGGRLIAVDAAQGPGVRFAEVFLECRPGTEGLVLKGLAEAMSGGDRKTGAEPPDRTVEETAPAAGVDASEIARAADIMKRSKSTVLIASQNPGSKALMELKALGDAAGAEVAALAWGGNDAGWLEMDPAGPRKRPGPGDLLEAVGSGEVKAVYGAGPLPLGQGIRPEFLVVQDCFDTSASERADAVLPSAAFTESRGTYVNAEGRVQIAAGISPPPGDSRPGWWILSALAKQRKKEGFEYKKAEDVFAEIRKVVPGFAPLSPSKLEKGEDVFIERDAAGSAVIPPAAEDRSTSPSKKFPLLLHLSHLPDFYGRLVLSREVKGLEAIRNPRWIFLHPEEAETWGLKPNDPVEIESAYGPFSGIARLSESIPKGVVKAFGVWPEAASHSAAPQVLAASRGGRAPGCLPVTIKRGT